ncbi:transglycosylase SLT domain-containing protein [Candidatus Woesebacteria bacterium]|nr:transglycosylase SLT domain-containing protein [Candidatus Woesebacteria bacterium]
MEEKIIKTAEEFNYSTTTALLIAKAESNLNPNAKNSHSTASGVYQFIDGTFKGYCVEKYGYATSTNQKNDPDVQIQCAVRMLSEGGENHWDASKHVWYNK